MSVRIGIEGSVCRLTLDRPAALNALTVGMVRQLDIALSALQTDASVAVVVIDAVPGPAFCAGGDIRAMHDAAKAGDWATCEAFFRKEYIVDARIARHAKPIVAREARIRIDHADLSALLYIQGYRRSEFSR